MKSPFIFSLLVCVAVCQIPYDIPSKEQVSSSLRKSLISSVPKDKQYYTVSSYLPQSQLGKLDIFIKDNAEFLEVSKSIYYRLRYPMQCLGVIWIVQERAWPRDSPGLYWGAAEVSHWCAQQWSEGDVHTVDGASDGPHTPVESSSSISAPSRYQGWRVANEVNF